MSRSRSPRHSPRLRTTPQQDRGRPGPGRGFEVKYTAKFREHPLPRRQAPSTLPWTLTRCLPPVAPDQTGWHPCLVHRSGPVALRGAACRTCAPGELAPMVQIHDAPVPHLVDKLEDVLKIRRSKCLRSPALPVLLLVGYFLCRSLWNSWWTFHCWSGCGLRSAPMLPAGCGPAYESSPRGSTGAWRAPSTPSGPARIGSPPAQGGI